LFEVTACKIGEFPMMVEKKLIYPLVAVLAFALCGLPEAVQAQEPTPQQPTQQAPQGQPTQQPSNPGVTVDPSQGPLIPPASTEQEQPATPNQQATPPEGPTPQTAPAQQQGQKEPLGAATAGSVRTQGGGASRPAGNAIAPAKQHQVRSFLIKFGAIAAAGVAVGTVYALTKGTPSVPPNSGR
jgi:hypothetical protein